MVTSVAIATIDFKQLQNHSTNSTLVHAAHLRKDWGSKRPSGIGCLPFGGSTLEITRDDDPTGLGATTGGSRSELLELDCRAA